MSKKLPGIVLAFLIAVPAIAQTVTIQFRVIDLSRAPLPGAIVTIRRADTQQEVRAITSEAGIATFNVEPGNYDLRAELSGFQTLTRSVDVKSAETIDLAMSIPLQPPAPPPSLTPEREQNEITAIPNLNNDLTPLFQVVPGAIATGSNSLGRIVFDGKGKDQQTILIDGVDVTLLTDLPAVDLALDVLGGFQKQEVAMDANKAAAKSRAFEAAFGPGTGSVTDAAGYVPPALWTAQAYSEQRNDALNARNFFDYEGKNGLRRSRFGGKVGGPLITNRLSLLVGYEGMRGRLERNLYEALPLEGSGGSALASLFSAYLPSGTTVVPGVSLNPDFQIGRRQARTSVDANAWNTRLDIKPASLNNLNLRYTRQAAENIVPDGVTGRLQRQHLRFNHAVAHLAFGSESTTNDVRLGFNETRGSIDVEAPAAAIPHLSQALITTGGTVKASGLPGAPSTVAVATIGALVKNVGRGFSLKPNSASLSYNYGHKRTSTAISQILFGIEARSMQMDFDRLGGLTYAFPNVNALRSGSPGSVAFLSDLSAPGPFHDGAGARQARQAYYLSYLQMVSSVTSKLTLTYGVRYDYFGRARERDGRAVVVDPRTAAILQPNAPFYRVTKNNFQPRFSLVYVLPDIGLLRNAVFLVAAGVLFSRCATRGRDLADRKRSVQHRHVGRQFSNGIDRGHPQFSGESRDATAPTTDLCPGLREHGTRIQVGNIFNKDTLADLRLEAALHGDPGTESSVGRDR